MVTRGRCLYGRLIKDCLKDARLESAVISRGAVAKSVERATPGERVLGSMAAVAALSLLVGSVSV